jgi:hypothetical protein
MKHGQGQIGKSHDVAVGQSQASDLLEDVNIDGIIKLTFEKGLRREVGWDGAVGTASRYGLDGPGSNPGGGEIFCTRPDGPWGPPSLLYNGYRVFPGSKAFGVLTTHPHLATRLQIK